MPRASALRNLPPLLNNKKEKVRWWVEKREAGKILCYLDEESFPVFVVHLDTKAKVVTDADNKGRDAARGDKSHKKIVCLLQESSDSLVTKLSTTKYYKPA